MFGYKFKYPNHDEPTGRKETPLLMISSALSLSQGDLNLLNSANFDASNNFDY